MEVAGVLEVSKPGFVEFSNVNLYAKRYCAFQAYLEVQASFLLGIWHSENTLK